MTKLRTAMPVVVIGAAVLFILLIVLEWGMDISGMNRGRVGAGDKIGSVDGEDFSYKAFEAQYTEQLDQQKKQQQTPDAGPSEEMEAQVRDYVWENFVSTTLFSHALAKLGIDVSDDEVRDVLIEDPPPFLRKSFTDSAGTFDAAAYQNTISRIANYQGSPAGQPDQMDTLYRTLLQIEESVRQTRLHEKFQSVMGSAMLVTDAELHEKFWNDNARADVAYALYDEALIPNNAVSLRENEVKEYYDKHSDEFVQQPARKAKYGFQYMVPSLSDSLAVQRKFNTLLDSLRSAPDSARQSQIFTQFSSRYNELENQNDVFTKMKDMSQLKAIQVLSTPLGGYSGVVAEADGYHVYRVIDERKGEDEYARFQQVVLPFGENKDSARRDAEAVIHEFEKQPTISFEQIAKRMSFDAASAARGGDMGYVAKGSLPAALDKAVFSAPTGKMVGPVETDAGFVLLRVNERSSREVKLFDIKMTVHVSSQTRQMQEHQMLQLHDRVAKGENFDSAGAALKIRVFESQPLTASTPLLGQIDFTQWVFNSKQGDVSEPKKMRGNTVILYVSEVRGKGVKPFDEVKAQIQQKLLHQKKLDNLMDRAKAMVERVRGDSIEHLRLMDTTVQVQTVNAVPPRGMVPGLGKDYAFSAAAFELENVGQISGPVRGLRGVYLLQLRRKALPNDSMFVLQKEIIRNSLQQQRRQEFVQTLLQKQKESAKVEDLREKFYRY